VWKASRGRGSVLQELASETQLLWATGDRLVFPWERDGFLQLYAVHADGGAARQLTRGRGEVEHVSLARDRRSLVYSSNVGDIDRRHVWRLDLARGEAVQLTRGRGIEWSPRPLVAGGDVAILRSDGRQPGRAAIVRAGQAPRDLPLEGVHAAFSGEGLVEPQAVSFPAADGLIVRGQLFVPRDLRPEERRPALVYLHGGSRRQMLLGWHYRRHYHHCYAFNQFLASRGFVVLSVNYRSGTGYGQAFREAAAYGAGGASELADVLGAAMYLRARPDVDPARIGAWGGSYGGYLTALALARASGLFAAGADWYGVSDWVTGIRNFDPDYAPDPAAERIARQASPLGHVDTWRSPVLIVHGDDDRNVAFVETVKLVERLRQRGVTVEVLVFPDEAHSFLTHRRWLEAMRATHAFFQRNLAGRQPAAKE
jgi:dipeptidyl aminopeptidase/acylaminoacyl peptidase